MNWKIAVVGATGNVGREMPNVLAERLRGRGRGARLASSMGVEVSLLRADAALPGSRAIRISGAPTSC